MTILRGGIRRNRFISLLVERSLQCGDQKLELSTEVEKTLKRANLTEEDLKHIRAENLLRLIPKILELLSFDVNNAKMLITIQKAYTVLEE